MIVWVEQGLVVVLAVDVREGPAELAERAEGDDLVVDAAKAAAGGRYLTGDHVLGRPSEAGPSVLLLPQVRRAG